MKKFLLLIFIVILSSCSSSEDKKTYYKCDGKYGETGPLFKFSSKPLDFSLVINWTKNTYLFQDWNQIKEFNDINNGKVKVTDIQVSSIDLKNKNGFELDLISGELNILIHQTQLFHGFCKVVQPKI
jgi:hypothetical protein